MKSKAKDSIGQEKIKVEDHQALSKSEMAKKLMEAELFPIDLDPVTAHTKTKMGERVNQDVYVLIQTVRAGIPYNLFQDLTETMPFTPAEWATCLHLSERTLQRYKKEAATFDALQSEKILEILLLFKKGTEVFEVNENFAAWLEASNVALGHVKPKDLLDSSFGINLLREELIRIEHGVLA